MEFELILAPETPDKYLLKAEKPLSGLAFVEEASKCLRRSLDTKTRMRHITLGNVAQYTISVPQSIAIECGYFNNASRVYLPCEENVLKDYVFHAATMAHGASNRPCYPYCQDEIVLTSYIDELAFLDVWRQRGYPQKMCIHLDDLEDIPLVDEATDVPGPSVGDLVLDDVLKGIS